METGIYFVHIGDNKYAPTHSHLIRHSDKVHKPDLGPVPTFNSEPLGCNPQCTCTHNPDGTWNIHCS